MGEFDQRVREGIDRVRGRWLRVRVLAGALRGLFYTGLGAAILALFLDLDPWMLALAVGVVALAWSATAALVQLPSRAALAKVCDDRLGLADRLASACQLREDADPMVELLREEAATAAERLEPARILPFRMPREGWLLPLPAILLAAVLFLPSLLSAEPPTDPLLEETIEARLDDLRELISREKAKEPTAERKELVEELERLLNELSREKIEKQDAMAELARAMERVEKAQEQKLEELKKLVESLREGDKTMQAIAQELEQDRLSEALNKLEQEMEDLQKKLEELKKQGANEKELEELEKELAKLRELKAKLKNLLQMDGDFMDLGEALDLLEDFEGDLADLSDLGKIAFVKPDCQCAKPGT